MSLLPPFLFVFDLTALLAGKERDWQDLSRLGDCFVPVAVLEELQSLSDRAPDPETEAKAREFGRFYPTSGWKKTEAIAEHSSLNPAAGHTLSKRARLSLEVLECAYGLARRHPQALVTLVANDQPMVQRLTPLKTNNLCGIPFTVLLQWHRTQRRPDIVSKHLQLMRLQLTRSTSTTPTRSAPPNQLMMHSTRSGMTSRSPSARNLSSQTVSRRVPTPSTNPHRLAVANPKPTSRITSATVVRPVQSYRRSPSLDLGKLLTNLLGWVLLAGIILTLWRFVSPSSFSQLWQQLPFSTRNQD
jgi:PIN domain